MNLAQVFQLAHEKLENDYSESIRLKNSFKNNPKYEEESQMLWDKLLALENLKDMWVSEEESNE